MEQHIEILLSKLKKDKDFAEKMSNAKSIEEAVELCKAEGIEITTAELKEFKNSKELTEDDLDNISGGTTTNIKVSGYSRPAPY
ncbi:MAG: Nif11-like leader peptide family natural product precursor [Firmicutes bacterium]|nr:Nif11-like leader peptide family natural product precursor [Bacillota bacterium]